MTDTRLLAVSVALKHATSWLDLAAMYSGDEYVTAAMNYFQHAAHLLGYRLIPITTPQQDHDALLAARVAEDGPPPVTSAPGFDGRDSSIGMREQDIEGAAV